MKPRTVTFIVTAPEEVSNEAIAEAVKDVLFDEFTYITFTDHDISAVDIGAPEVSDANQD